MLTGSGCGRVRAVMVAVAAVVVAVAACGSLPFGGGASPSPAATAVVPADVDPSEGEFTCPGVPDASVKAVIGDVLLTSSTDQQNGVVRYLKCEGRTYSGKSSPVFYAQFGQELRGWYPWQLTPIPQSPYYEAFDVPGVEGATGEFGAADDGGGSALITCGDSFVLVTFSGRVSLNGDLQGNVANLAVSMTPWACNGEPIPGLGIPLSPALDPAPLPTETDS